MRATVVSMRVDMKTRIQPDRTRGGFAKPESTKRGDETMESTWSYLDMALGRQEEWDDSPSRGCASAATAGGFATRWQRRC
jgi:predicted dithiol-disulfide oxidoreductase (DUF899 family)